MKLKKLFILIAALIFTVGCSKSIKPNNFTGDGTIIIEQLNKDKPTSQFYVKQEEKMQYKIVDNAVSSYGYNYVRDDKDFIYLDLNGCLQRVSENGEVNTIAVGISPQNELGSLGYLDAVSKDVENGQYYTQRNYAISKNFRTIAYIDVNLGLYIEKNRAKAVLDSNVSNFAMDVTGEYIYYLKDGSQLNLYNDAESEKIADNVQKIMISQKGKTVVWKDKNSDVKLKNVDSDDIYNVYHSKNDFKMKVYDDGSLIYLDNSNDLYIFFNGEATEIASNVVDFKRSNNFIYYLDKNNTLFEVKLDDLNNQREIKKEVEDVFILAENIYYLDKDGNLYKREKNEFNRISGDVLDYDKENEFYNYSDVNMDIAYKTSDNNLYLGNKKIADNVGEFSFNPLYVAYTTSDNQVYVYNIKDDEKVLAVSDMDDYSNIYLCNQLLHKNE